VADHRVTGLAELPCGQMKRVDVAGTAVCVVHAEDGTFFAINDVCSHEDASLSEGWVYDREIECPRHNSVFDLSTGEATSLPATEPVAVYPIVVDGDDVMITVSAGETA
jgi:3-phenylpropionate/trans-cinnamate dioxygenase ferredoxin subunit